jgi:hypothetical protein
MSILSTADPRDAMSRGGTSDLLRGSLRIDGWGTAVFGVVMLVGGQWLTGPLGLPSAWFVPVGIAMLGGAAALGLIAGYPRIPPRLAGCAIAGNALSGLAILTLVIQVCCRSPAWVSPSCSPGQPGSPRSPYSRSSALGAHSACREKVRLTRPGRRAFRGRRRLPRRGARRQWRRRADGHVLGRAAERRSQ